MSHEFDLSVQMEIKHTDAKPINVKEDTIWINISINVVINDFNFINNSPIQNYSLLERYVLVTIEDQDKEEYFQKEFLETAEVHRQLLSPQKGLWAVKVEAVGLGYQELKDSYRIDVIANEPV